MTDGQGDAARDVPPGQSFAETLHELIERYGFTYLGLAARLKEHGVQVSPATLHHWAAGRSCPERPDSLRALAVLESLLQLPEGAMLRLVPASRKRGRGHRRNELVPVELLWDHPEPVRTAIKELGCPYEGRRTVSLHERYHLDARGVEALIGLRLVLEAVQDEVDSFLIIQRDETGWGALPEPHPLWGCRLGRIRRDLDAGFLVAELLLDQRLRRGERTLVEYELRYDSRPGRPSPGTDRRFAAPIREYVLEVVFDPSTLPVRCHSHGQAAGSEAIRQEELRLAGSSVARQIVLDAPAGIYGMAWEWPAAIAR